MQNQLKAIIIDDELLAIDTLAWQLKNFCHNVEVLNRFTNPLLAYKWLQTHSVDLCFLDIDMPELSGFDFLKLFGDHISFDVIFTTAYSEYAIEAFKVSAIDYLLKPIDEEDLVNTVEKYRQRHLQSVNQKQLHSILQQLQTPKPHKNHIALPTLEAIHVIDINDIIRIQADNNYTTLILHGDKKLIVSKTLKEIDSLLDPELFIRVHQSHSVSVNNIVSYQKGRGGNLTMIDGAIIPVSKNKKEAVLRWLFDA